MIWFKKYELKDLNDLNKNTMGENLGLEFVEITDDTVIAKMPVDSRTVQPFRILHGGASAALAETLGSVASMMCVDVEKNVPVGIELNINHLRSESKGFVFGHCKPIRVGKSVHVWQIDIKNEQDKLVATSRLTTMVIDRK
jgi:1,4-dihydroxy-2-naphthoyl-CoA hydrolase